MTIIFTMDPYVLQQHLELRSVLNNGFSTQPFAVEKGVRQGEPLSVFLFIMVLEILCISVCNKKDIHGIVVDSEEIKLGLFADDLTGFLKDDLCLTNFLKLIKDYRNCSGLQINHEKSEILLLDNRDYILQESNVVSDNIHDLKVNKSVKILAVHSSYAFQDRHKLNVDEVISCIQQKTTNLEVERFDFIGRIQIVKTFIIPILLYRAGLIPVGKDFVKQANKLSSILFGKERIKLSVLPAFVSEIEDGGFSESPTSTGRV